MWIYLISIILSMVMVEFLYRYATRTGKLINKIRGPISFPLVGNLWDVYLLSERKWDYVKELVDNYYPIFKMWLWNYYAIALLQPDDLKVLLSCKTNVQKTQFVYDDMNCDGMDGIFLSTGQKWKNRRKLLNPAFKPELIRHYAKVVDKRVGEFMKNFLPNGRENILDLPKTFPALSFEIICESAMGVDVRKMSPKAPETFIHAFEDVGAAMFYFAACPYIPYRFQRLMKMGKLREEGARTMCSIAEQIIRERRKYHEENGFKTLTDDVEDGILENNNNNNDVDNKKFSSKKLGFLDHLLAAELKGLIDEKGIMEETNIALVGGYDTVSVAAAFALMLLAENKEAQDSARAEILKVTSENGGSIRTAEVSKFTYLECCIKESMRLYPSAPVIGRKIVKEMQLPNYTIPANTHVGIPIMMVHRDPNFWPEPMKYKPERFLPENSKDRHPYAWLPFSTGPRGCIGQKLGFMETVSIVGHILQKFEIEPIDSTKDVKFDLHITLKPSKPLRAKFIRISKESSDD